MDRLDLLFDKYEDNRTCSSQDRVEIKEDGDGIGG